MDYAFILAFGVYLGILALITVASYKKSDSQEEFLLGNRSLNYVATAIAAHSSDMSIWLFMGFPGAVYCAGMQEVWLPLGLLVGMYLSWTFVALKLRTSTETLGCLTLSHYFEKRFNDTSGLLRLVSAFFGILFFLFYISSGLVGMGLMLESVFGMNYHVGIFISLLTTILYIFAGGFMAIAACDLFQGLFLVLMILIVPFFGYGLLQNGWADINSAAQIKNISLSLIPDTFTALWSSILLAVSWGLGYFGQPHILVNFMGIKNPQDMHKAKYVGMAWQVLTLGAALLVGLIGIGIFTTPLANKELVFVTMVQQLFPAFFAGLVLCAIIAACLTTIDTQILVSASILSEDLYKQYINPNATRKDLLAVSRFGILLFPCLSFIIAFSKSSSVFGLVNYAWCGLGSTFGPAVLTSLYSKNTTKNAVLVGMITGGCIAAFWQYTGSSVPAMIPAFFINLAIIVIGSKIELFLKK